MECGLGTGCAMARKESRSRGFALGFSIPENYDEFSLTRKAELTNTSLRTAYD